MKIVLCRWACIWPMNSFSRFPMQIMLSVIIGWCVVSGSGNLMAQPVPFQTVDGMVNGFLKKHAWTHTVLFSERIAVNETLSLTLYHLEPAGYILAAGNLSLPAVMAYSFENEFDFDSEPGKSILKMMKTDMLNRLEYQSEKSRMRNVTSWNDFSEWETRDTTFQQWPPEGTTPTGGWLVTNWTQTQPYNALCPIDGQSGNRSVAGCPATAMAQIVNYLKRTNSTRFSDDDDYYHSFGANNSYWIDDAFLQHDFPSWPKLNVKLDTLEHHYNNNVTLTSDDKAALTYACGVAARQVYSSSVSGTYGIDQAFDAFQKFGFAGSMLVMPDNPSLIQHLAQNIMLGCPAHLGLVDPGWTVGHNVVVDGYNTDEFYHFNFGWGGSANGWYTMPPQEIPYNLTVIEGVVLDIGTDAPPVLIDEPGSKPDISVKYRFDEGKLSVAAHTAKPEKLSLMVTDLSGDVLFRFEVTLTPETSSLEIPCKLSTPGVYIIAAFEEKYAVGSEKILIW